MNSLSHMPMSSIRHSTRGRSRIAEGGGGGGGGGAQGHRGFEAAMHIMTEFLLKPLQLLSCLRLRVC